MVFLLSEKINLHCSKEIIEQGLKSKVEYMIFNKMTADIEKLQDNVRGTCLVKVPTEEAEVTLAFYFSPHRVSIVAFLTGEDTISCGTLIKFGQLEEQKPDEKTFKLITGQDKTIPTEKDLKVIEDKIEEEKK